jgi:hypothetical protein
LIRAATAAFIARGVTQSVSVSGPSGYILDALVGTVFAVPPPRIDVPRSRTRDRSSAVTPPAGAKNVKIDSPPDTVDVLACSAA